MTLTKEQIDQLFAFTEKKFVRHYDLQVELVDHLAAKIEEEMEADKSISFEHALQKVYASFGIFGFAHVVQEKSNALYKKNNKLWWTEFWKFFTLPKLVITVVVFLSAYYIGSFISPAWKLYSLIICYFGFTVYFMRQFFRSKKAITKKLFLLQNHPYTNVFGPIILMEQMLIFSQEIRNNVLFAIICVLAFISQAVLLELSRNIQQQAKTLYPEAFQSA